MGGTKTGKTPREERASENKAAAPDGETMVKKNSSAELKTPLQTPAKRIKMKASAFASKKASSRRKSRGIRNTPAKSPTNIAPRDLEASFNADEQGESVDDVLKQVKELMRSGKMSEDKRSKELMEALKKADETFNTTTEHGSSDSDEGPPKPLNSKASNGSTRKKRRRSELNITGDDEPVASTPHAKHKTKSPAQTPKLIQTSKLKTGIAPSEKTPNAANSARKAKTSKSERKQKVQSSRKTPRTAKKKKENADCSDDEPSASRLKADIEALKKDDPDFYKFLEENDAGLLEISDSDEEQDADDGAGKGEALLRGEAPKSKSSEGAKSPHKVAETGSARKKRQQDQKKKIVSQDGRGDNEANEESQEEKSDMDTSGQNVPNAVQDALHSTKKTTKVHEDSVGTSDSPETSADSEGDDEHELQSSEKTEDVREVPADITGYSESEDEHEAEKEAAAVLERPDSDAEEGEELETRSKQSQPSKTESTFVDMQYIRKLRQSLKSNRTSLKVCKDMLKLLRAGRDVIPKAKPLPENNEATKVPRSKPKRAYAKVHAEDEAEQGDFADDGRFSSGNITFASASAYQQAMSLAITGIQDVFDNILEKPSENVKSRDVLKKWNPTDHKRWAKVQVVFRPYVYHMIMMCNSIRDPGTLRFLFKRMEKFVPYMRGVEGLLKRIVRIAVRAWSSGVHDVSNATRLRAYLLLNHLAHGEGNAETVLRSCCNAFAKNIGAVCNPKTLPLIHFLVMCLVELFGIDMGASYTTAFSYLREMSISLRAVLTAKDGKEEVERLHNWSYINMLRLWSKVLGRYGSEDELRPLIYPYVQISLGVLRVYPSPRTHPMRIHIASYLSDLTAETGVFIPVIPHLLTILRSSELRRTPDRGYTKVIEWRTILRVSDDVVKTRLFLTGLVDRVVHEMSRYFAIVSKHPSFPELTHLPCVTLKRFAKEFQVATWKVLLTSMVEKLRQSSDIITRARSRADFSPHGALSPEGMLASVPGLDDGFKTPIQRFFEVEDTRLSKEGRLRDEKSKNSVEDTRSAESSSGESEDMEEQKAVAPARKKRKRSKSSTGNAPLLRLPDPERDEDDKDQLAELVLDTDDSGDERDD
ncbi:Nucleolar complex protein 2-like [Gracilariopsis chorda]|uniref:Nucleolar complex protein 2-like n=1 Tax=Gracilariopsis chorda TaxID=448386 RepID=A0A2V3JBX8_9FLOR|nr:Nucleolar complex protein 2-like [Gracilariopsis chorda]|eukprot:PXF49910.1 Nucleolar complex protein 2-like [Gracilariopsis chorda]